MLRPSLRFLAAFLFASGLVVGCAVDRPTPAPWSGLSEEEEDDERWSDEEAPPGCTPGAVKSCKITFPKQGEVQNCFVGERVCGDDGGWGPCEEPLEQPKGNEEGLDQPVEMPELEQAEVFHVAV